MNDNINPSDQDEQFDVDNEFDESGEDEQLETDADEQETEVGEKALEEMARDVLAAVDKPELTPYQIHSVVNTLLEALGSDYTVRPQMMYNYDRNGLLVKGEKGKKRYTPAEILPFVVKFVSKHAGVKTSTA